MMPTVHSALDRIYQQALQKLDASYAEPLERAYKLAYAGHIQPSDRPQCWDVTGSTGSLYIVAHTADGWQCTCPDHQYRHHPCYHVLGCQLFIRAMQAVQAASQGLEEPTVEEKLAEWSSFPPAVEANIDTLSKSPVAAEHLVTIQGKPFIKFAGLLQMAHAAGLVALSEAWTYNDADLSLAHAVATFTDGRCFAGSGDATPSNVTRKVAPHFRRVALTRAKSRALRDALNIDLVSVEELGEE